jgi:hypothetical protein
MYDYTGIVTETFKGKVASHTREIFNRFTTKTQLYFKTSYIIRKVMQCETFSGGYYRCFKRSTRHKRTVTKRKLLSLCPKYIAVQ